MTFKPVATFLLLVAALSTNAQPPDTARTILYGTVTDEFGNKLGNTYILLKGSPWGTTTDTAGYYHIEITGYLQQVPKPIIEFQYLGYKYVQYVPDKHVKGEVRYDLKFYEHNDDPGPYTNPKKKHKHRKHKHKH